MSIIVTVENLPISNSLKFSFRKLVEIKIDATSQIEPNSTRQVYYEISCINPFTEVTSGTGGLLLATSGLAEYLLPVTQWNDCVINIYIYSNLIEQGGEQINIVSFISSINVSATTYPIIKVGGYSLRSNFIFSSRDNVDLNIDTSSYIYPHGPELGYYAIIGTNIDISGSFTGQINFVLPVDLGVNNYNLQLWTEPRSDAINEPGSPDLNLNYNFKVIIIDKIENIILKVDGIPIPTNDNSIFTYNLNFSYRRNVNIYMNAVPLINSTRNMYYDISCNNIQTGLVMSDTAKEKYLLPVNTNTNNCEIQIYVKEGENIFKSLSVVLNITIQEENMDVSSINLSSLMINNLTAQDGDIIILNYSPIINVVACPLNQRATTNINGNGRTRGTNNLNVWVDQTNEVDGYLINTITVVVVSEDYTATETNTVTVKILPEVTAV